MAFPISITGTLVVAASNGGGLDGPTSRLHEALAAETVDHLLRQDDTLSFRSRAGFHKPVPRPGGKWWLFSIFTEGKFAVEEAAVGVRVRYSLSTRQAFFVVTALSAAVGSVIHLSAGPDHEWGFVFGLGMWLVMFASQYLSKAIEVRKWLRKVLTQSAPYRAAPLRIDLD